MSIRISVDCDIAFTRTDIDFLHYLEDITGVYNHGIEITNIDQKVDYDLTKYFKPELDKLGLTGFEFWDNQFLYDNRWPIAGSVQTLLNLYNQGCDITFVSHVIGSHAQSKIDFLHYFCPFIQDVFITENKEDVPCDIIIEDRVQNLKNFTKDTVGIIIDNKYIKHEKYECPYSVVRDWSEVEDRVWWLIRNYF